ncbi:MAG: hypothetical protein QXM16_07215 [Nitrososphaerota archaeon]
MVRIAHEVPRDEGRGGRSLKSLGRYWAAWLTVRFSLWMFQ